MSWVFEPPPTEIEVDGVLYRLNTDWESCLWVWRAHQFLEDEKLSELGYLDVIVEKMFVEPKPDIFNEKALKLAIDYLNAFSDKDDEIRKTKIPPINIEQDIEMIYRAFAAMGINLRKKRIDYEEFQALLPNIPKESEYGVIMGLRSKYYNGYSKMTKEEKQACGRIGWDKIRVRENTKKKDDDFQW